MKKNKISFKQKKRFFTTFQELPLGIPLNSEKLSLFSDSEHYQAK
jgi:hypothetical protein